MARPMHVHRSIRRERLAIHKKITRSKNAPPKRKARTRRDARMAIAVAAAAGKDLHPAVQSWVSAQLGKPFSKVTEAELKSLV